MGALPPDVFERHAAAQAPLPLQQILRMARMEFRSGPNGELGRAQAYTLVYFLLKYDDGKYRQGFLDFLRSSYTGQGSQTHFERALGLEDLVELEAAWNAYAKDKAKG